MNLAQWQRERQADIEAGLVDDKPPGEPEPGFRELDDECALQIRVRELEDAGYTVLDKPPYVVESLAEMEERLDVDAGLLP